MASRNADSLNPAQGEFKPRVPRDEPLQGSGHKPGVKTSPADHVPESHVQTLPPGTAPKDRTFAPDATSEVPGQADNDASLRSHGKESTYTSTASTLSGATSADVHTGLGHPGQGQTSTEIRHDGQHTRKRVGAGLEGVGASGVSGVDERYDPSQRGLERDEALGGQHGDKGSLGAEDIVPADAETVAAERS